MKLPYFSQFNHKTEALELTLGLHTIFVENKLCHQVCLGDTAYTTTVVVQKTHIFSWDILVIKQDHVHLCTPPPLYSGYIREVNLFPL